VNAGSLYHFFPSKEALLTGVLERYTHLLRPIVMDPVEATTADPIERIFALLQQYRQWLSPNGFAMGCPIGNLALELSDGYKDIRALIHLNFRNWVGVVQSWLDAAGDRLPANTNRQQLAQLILTGDGGGHHAGPR
jgi:TetR/AcrR family transcriptional repressor of nem operon